MYFKFFYRGKLVFMLSFKIFEKLVLLVYMVESYSFYF